LELKKVVEPGISTQILEDKAQELFRESGGKPAFLGYRPEGVKRPYPASVCVSVNDEIVHGIPNENAVILQEGDIVTLDSGMLYEGLITDHAITVTVGEVDKESKRLIAVTEESLYAGIKAAQVGNTVGDIGAAIEAVGKKAGFGICEGLCGHGVGYSVHEDPYVPNIGTPGQGMKLKEGLVIAIEPMFALGVADIIALDDEYTYVTADAQNAAHFEHTIAITADGPRILTK
jgi:methionyl aminopeptidase